MSARMASVAGNFADVEVKLIVPLSAPMSALTVVPSSCRAFDSASPSRVVVPSLRSAAVSDATPCRPGASNWLGAAEERDREGHQRQVVLLGHEEIGAVGQRGLRPRRHAQRRGGARLGDLGAIEDALGGAGAGQEQQQQQGESRQAGCDAPHFSPPGFLTS